MPSGRGSYGTSASIRGATAGQHDFARIPSANIPRSVFNRSRPLRTAFNSGLLIPVFVDEVLPGDTMALKANSFVRLTTPLVPVMDNLWLDWFWFFVPNRLLWDKWERFMGEQLNPGDSIDFLVPQLETTTPEGSMSDYFGLPLGVTKDVNALHFRAYNKIWNEWFRDQNLQDRADENMGDGPDLVADYPLRRRGKRHDYFTSSLPFAQKGDPVTLPLGTSAPVSGTIVPGAGQFSFGVPTFNLPGDATARELGTVAGANAHAFFQASGGGTTQGDAGWNIPALALSGASADLTAATAATINQIREAFQVQKLLERDARGGSRYTEILRSHFGVISADQRLQRPEWLGGGSSRINFHPVARTTAPATSILPLAELGAFATTGGQGVGFLKSFTEHGVIVGLVSVRADLTYQQGLNRMWSRQTRYDFFWPELAHLGEQAVLSQEIYSDGTGDPVAGTGDFSVWGYQERYAEYRYSPGYTTAGMRSTSAAPMDIWHLGMEFGSRPLLNDVFIEDTPPVDRVIAVSSLTTNGYQFFGDFWFECRHTRPMPTFSVPGLIDHF